MPQLGHKNGRVRDLCKVSEQSAHPPPYFLPPGVSDIVRVMERCGEGKDEGFKVPY